MGRDILFTVLGTAVAVFLGRLIAGFIVRYEDRRPSLELRRPATLAAFVKTAKDAEERMARERMLELQESSLRSTRRISILSLVVSILSLLVSIAQVVIDIPSS